MGLTVADPDLEVRGRGGGVPGLDLLAMAAIFPSVITSLFTQNKRGPGPPRALPLDPPLLYITKQAPAPESSGAGTRVVIL